MHHSLAITQNLIKEFSRCIISCFIFRLVDASNERERILRKKTSQKKSFCTFSLWKFQRFRADRRIAKGGQSIKSIVHRIRCRCLRLSRILLLQFSTPWEERAVTPNNFSSSFFPLFLSLSYCISFRFVLTRIVCTFNFLSSFSFFVVHLNQMPFFQCRNESQIKFCSHFFPLFISEWEWRRQARQWNERTRRRNEEKQEKSRNVSHCKLIRFHVVSYCHCLCTCSLPTHCQRH